MTRLATFVERRRRSVLAAGMALFAIGVGFGVPVAGKLTARSSDFQDPGSEAMVAQTRLNEATKSRDPRGFVALVHTRGDVRSDAAARRKLQRVERILAAQPEVGRVVSYASTRDRSLVSRDGHSAYVAAAVAQNDSHEVAKRLQTRFAGHRIEIGGSQVVFTEIRARARTT